MKQIIARVVLLFMFLGAFTGAEAQTTTYTVAGTISGLASGKTVVLKNNLSTIIVASTSSSFTFPAQSAGTSWNVSVAIQPAGQTCNVTNPSGTNISANITNVVVTCVSTYTVAGTVTGLTSGSLVLRMGTVSLVVSGTTSNFKFGTGLINGSTYVVLVGIQPSGFQCTPANNIGVINGANITNVSITCARTYTVGGTITGLTGSGLTLKLNTVSKPVAPGTTAFTFASALKAGVAYTVTVLTQPSGQTCTVTNGTGTIVDSNITDVLVNCVTTSSSSSSATSSVASSSASSSSVGSSASSSSSSSVPTNYTVSGTASGLGSGKSVVLQNNGANNQTVTYPATGFSFPAQADGSGYNVTVLTQPVGQTCTLLNNSGTLAGANVTNVSVTCTDTTYTISGSVYGLTASGLSLSLSGSKSDSVNPASGATSYAFMQTLENGNSYTVTISAQPTGLTCTLSPNPATGTVDTTNIVVDVTCTVKTYTIAVTNSAGAAVSISGSTATNATNPNSATSFNFSAKHGDAVVLSATKTGNTCSVATTPVSINPITGNATATVTCTLNAYSIAVTNVQAATVTITGSTALGNTSPNNATSISFNANHGDNVGLSAAKTGYTCTVTPSSIASIAANASASVSCTSAGTYTVSGKLTGNTGTVTLLNNGTNSTSVLRPKGTFSFSSGLGDGSAYNVTVSANPTGQICLVLNGSGVIAAANITNVLVSCTTNTYTLGGTVSGLGNGLSVVLLKNGSDALSITANGSFTFASPMAAGAYVVSIGTQPLGQSCVITNGSGTVSTTNITNITVTCSTNVNGCSSAGNAGVPSSDPFWAIYSAPTSPGVDTTPLITSELPNLFQSCLPPT